MTVAGTRATTQARTAGTTKVRTPGTTQQAAQEKAQERPDREDDRSLAQGERSVTRLGAIVAVANQKGGVAKTTSVASLGAAFAELGKQVLLVDLDAQACLTFSLGVDPDAVTVSINEVLVVRGVAARDAIVGCADGVDLIPSVIELAGAEAQLLPRPGREYVLRSVLEPLRQDYDIILVDCSPSLGVLTLNALTAAQGVIIPMPCEMLSHRGVGQLLDTITDVKAILNPGLEVFGILPTLYDGRSKHARAVLADVGERYGLPVLSPPIPKTVRFAEAPALGRSILSTSRSSKGAKAYREVATSLLPRFQPVPSDQNRPEPATTD
ncbi:MAG: ParA family protein [Dermatophilaceae bacterium]|nr:ParA family protein [Dermatophilaceae bacterium]